LGTLNLPASGIVYVDAVALIYTIEQNPTYFPILEPVWRGLSSGVLRVATSELSLLETLVVPLRNRDQRLVSDHRALMDSRGFSLVPISQSILLAAAQLRASIQNFKTPDAIHCATAKSIGAAMVITNDRAWPSVPGLPAILLDDVVKASGSLP
jgi:predicted nucleic acid-binding protein